MKVVDYLIETLEANGVELIFGNPGTTEIPLVRACERHPTLRYVVALSEIAAVPMADGYARATRKLGVVNLHVAPGLGSGMGTLYTAGIAGTPLLVLIGGQDRRFLHTHPILWGPLEAMARAVCKDVFSLNTRYDAAANVRRALRCALTPPYAPVALVCPPDLLEQDVTATPTRIRAPSLAAFDPQTAERYARFLEQARKPALVAAEDVHWSPAAAQNLEALAARLNAPVYAAPYTGVLPIAASSPWYAGYLPPSLKQISERLADYDALLFVGGRGPRTTLYSEGALPQRKAWIGTDSRVQTIDGEFDLAHVADIGASLSAIASLLPGSRSPAETATRTPLDLPPARSATLHPTRAVALLLERFANAIWFDESGLSTSDVRQWMKLAAGDYVINGSGGIGWGLPAAVGAAIGRPERPVVAAIGDGSALYASEALWTAGHHGATNMRLVVFANRRYATLNAAAERVADGALHSFTIEPPVLDFSGLAKLHGWNYSSAATEEELKRVLSGGEQASNTLIELKLDPAAQPVTASRHF